MIYYAQLRKNSDGQMEVVEILPEFSDDFPGVPIQERFAPSFLALCEPIGEEVQLGWIKNEDGAFSPPSVLEEPEASNE